MSGTKQFLEYMNWNTFKDYYLSLENLGIAVDISRIHFRQGFFSEMEDRMVKVFDFVESLESGSIANPDENRKVGHYWLRNPDLAPDAEIKNSIIANLKHIKDFTNRVHSGQISGVRGAFRNILVIGIGGSALGPQFVSQALGFLESDPMRVFFLDNTDPDGIDLVLGQLRQDFDKTMNLVISKSGGTPETRNGMLEVKAEYEASGLNFAEHAVAITGENSALYHIAKSEGWIDIFPMWDWVGGRTSELASVGLLPAALQGIDIDRMLEGARDMDIATRNYIDPKCNPAARLCLAWYAATDGKGKKDMVILPYKDRLMLFSKYLQQLIMESLGKEKDLKGNTVHQGIAVYGNKGSTDQHAYVQQLREGVHNFFVTFIEVLRDRHTEVDFEVEPGVTSGDYLHSFYLGTRNALYENGRQSITITVNDVTPYTVGALIALYERAVSFYAYLVGINAYHQPGVEAGKKAAAAILKMKLQIVEYLKQNAGKAFTAEVLANQLKLSDKTEIVFKLLNHLAENPLKRVHRSSSESFDGMTFTYDN